MTSREPDVTREGKGSRRVGARKGRALGFFWRGRHLGARVAGDLDAPVALQVQPQVLRLPPPPAAAVAADGPDIELRGVRRDRAGPALLGFVVEASSWLEG